MKNFEIIENFLRGSMSEEEEADFQKKINTDKALALEVETQRFELELIDTMEEDILRSQLMEYEKNIEQSSKGTTITIRKHYSWLIGLSSFIVVLLLIRFFFFEGVPTEQIPEKTDEKIRQSAPHEELNKEQQKTETKREIIAIDDSVSNKRKGKENSRSNAQIALVNTHLSTAYTFTFTKGLDERIDKLTNAYNQHEYNNVIAISDSLLANQTSIDIGTNDVFFIRGLSFLYLKKYSSARDAFLNDLEFKEKNAHDKTRWFLALAYLKNGQIQKAKEILKIITQHPKRQYQKGSAKLLLEELQTMD